VDVVNRGGTSTRESPGGEVAVEPVHVFRSEVAELYAAECGTEVQTDVSRVVPGGRVTQAPLPGEPRVQVRRHRESLNSGDAGVLARERLSKSFLCFALGREPGACLLPTTAVRAPTGVECERPAATTPVRRKAPSCIAWA
jgi:hypothetical protein